MGVGRIFSGGANRGFFQYFSMEEQSGKFCFFPLKTKNTTFFAKQFQYPGEGQVPSLPPLPTPMSESWLKVKSSHFRKCCEENFYLCVRLMQNRMEIFSTAAKLFVWRLRLRVQKAQSPHYWQMGGKNLKSVNLYKYLGATVYWILSSQMTKTFRDNCDKNIVQQRSCEPLFPDVQMQSKTNFFRSFCTPMYASQIWWNFRKSCMQRLRVSYNFGCRSLCNLPWRASVSSHDSSGSM